MSTALSIEPLPAQELPAALPGLVRVLHACVRDGASIGFLWPLAPGELEAYWTGLGPELAGGERVLLVARQAGELVGTVQLVLEHRANGRHRAEVSKLLVHPEARRLGVARGLMLALEALARARGRSLLLLDTRTGDAAERLYLSLGYQLFGQVPAYACSPAGVPETCSFMFKVVSPRSGGG